MNEAIYSTLDKYYKKKYRLDCIRRYVEEFHKDRKDFEAKSRPRKYPDNETKSGRE